jgi:hypothetical protein
MRGKRIRRAVVIGLITAGLAAGGTAMVTGHGTTAAVSWNK